MNPENHEWDGAERRAPSHPSSPHSPQPWRIVEPDESMCPVRYTTTPPEDYDEAVRKLKERMGKA